jgi:ABC-type metal ion transport system substrate-binding protein
MYKPTEQDREPRIKPMHIWSSHLQKVSKLLNGERIASSTNDAWKTGEPHAKE